ncbi:hypothetical protein [Streptomyces altiplanensis]
MSATLRQDNPTIAIAIAAFMKQGVLPPPSGGGERLQKYQRFGLPVRTAVGDGGFSESPGAEPAAVWCGLAQDAVMPTP